MRFNLLIFIKITRLDSGLLLRNQSPHLVAYILRNFIKISLENFHSVVLKSSIEIKCESLDGKVS